MYMQKQQVELSYGQRSKIAEENFKRFIGLLEYVTDEKNVHFDLVVAAGNSGNFMLKLVEMYYKKAKREKPVFLSLPIFIYRVNKNNTWAPKNQEEQFDNLVLVPMVCESIKNLSKIENVLFVDDEIGYGSSAKASLDVLLEGGKEKIKRPLNFVIMAENHWFKWESEIPDVTIHFYTIGKQIAGLTHTITELVPLEFQEKCTKVNGETDRKIIMNMILNLPTKKIEGGKPKFTYEEYEEITKGFNNIKKWQDDFKKKIERLIEEGIEDYKKNKTDLMLEYSS